MDDKGLLLDANNETIHFENPALSFQRILGDMSCPTSRKISETHIWSQYLFCLVCAFLLKAASPIIREERL